MKPVIGITTSLIEGFAANDQNYSISVVKAGGIPLLIPPLHDLRQVVEIVKRIDGLILSGGQDISPMLYDEDPHPKCGEFSDRRDQFEIAMYQQAKSQNMPILAICRGFQLVNAIHEGTLVQDIVAQREDSLVHAGPNAEVTRHRIQVMEDSLLFRCLGETAIVNSIHHQAIKDLGKDFVITAKSADGVIEGFEGDNLIGVQFHPERLHRQEPFLEIFREFIRRAQ